MNGNTGDGLPLSQRIKKDICAAIRSGQTELGGKLPTERNLAEQYGVCRMTARKALEELTNEGVLYRIRGKGTFVASMPDAQTDLADEADSLISVIVPTVRMSFFSEIIHGANEVLTRRGYQILLSSANSDSAEERGHLSRVQQATSKGLILVAGAYSSTNADVIEQLRSRLPVVVVNQCAGVSNVDKVHSDDRRGAYLATSHLIELGHQRIAHLAAVEDRTEGYRDALREHNIEFDPGLVRTTGWKFDTGYSETRKLLINAADVTAIFACSDVVAAGALKALSEVGMRVPDHMALVGYGNVDIGRFLEVPLTTVDQFPEEMGRSAARLLLEKLSGRRTLDESLESKLPTELIVRRSCGIRRPMQVLVSSRVPSESEKAAIG